MSDNPFTRLVREARAQGAARDALIAKHRATLAPIPQNRGTYTYVTSDVSTCEALARNARCSSTRNKLRRWTRRNVADGGYYAYAYRGAPTVALAPRNRQLDRMTHNARWLIAEIRCSAAREALPADLRQNRTYRLDGTVSRSKATYDASPYRGLVNAREARYSERGASGIRGVRGAAARVSVRDNHSPVEVLKVMPSVGVATHPGASHADYSYLIDLVRKTPSLATLTRLMPGPHGLLRTVVPVSAYREVRDVRHARKLAPTDATLNTREAKALALIAKLPAIADYAHDA